MIHYDIKYFSSDECLRVNSNDFKSFKYETKKRVDESAYDSGKRSYCERRGGLWRPGHPRQVRKLESKLRDKDIITCDWTTDSLVTIVVSSGDIVYLSLKPATLDVKQILFDRYFVGKLSGLSISNVVISKTYMLLTHNDRTATLVTFGKTNMNLPCRIADRDPHIQTIELSGNSRRIERYISKCETNSGGRLLVWSVTIAEPAPWSPVIEDHANLHLYGINGHLISLLAYHQLDDETISAELAFKSDNVIHVVEHVTCQKNGINLSWLRYDITTTEDHATKLSCSRESATQVSLPTPVRAVRRSPCDTRLLVACIDGSLHVVHSVAGITHTTKAGFIATDVRWAGELIIAAEEGGRLQCFDRALSLLHHHSKCLEFSSNLKENRRLQMLTTKNTQRGPIIMMAFAGGPLGLLHITHPRLITAWMRMKRWSNAVALLLAMDWEREGTECLWAINKIVCEAIRSKVDGERAGWAGAAALGAYLAPRAPLPPAAARFAPPVHDLARKLFHHLLRRGRIEMALRLAVELAAWDLFVDARCAAARGGLTHLAREAAALAAEHAATRHDDSECSSSCSSCSSHSYTESEDELSATSKAIKTEPPPLPRVILPEYTTMMQVPKTQTEPTSTNSIRPNLHQYLERDNTIWTKNVRDNHSKLDYERDYPKPIRNSQNLRWHSTDALANYTASKHGLVTINESPVKSTQEEKVNENRRKIQEEKLKHLYQVELREELPERNNTLYRYQNNNNYHPSTSLKDRNYRMESDGPEKSSRVVEKNKVKFSDTITVAVVSDQDPEPARELAASLPLSPPHKYLAAFTPQHLVQQQQQPTQQQAQQQAQQHKQQSVSLAENLPPRPPKIKVVHFGMV